jgi:hypothetical protein
MSGAKTASGVVPTFEPTRHHGLMLGEVVVE